MGRTPYAETELLLACMEDDQERAKALASDFYIGEARALKDACQKVIDTLNDLVPANKKGSVTTYHAVIVPRFDEMALPRTLCGADGTVQPDAHVTCETCLSRLADRREVEKTGGSDA